MDAFTDNTHFLAYLETKPNDPTLCPSALFALNIAICFSNRFVEENKGFIRSGLSTELACTAQAEKVEMYCNKALCKSHQHSSDTAHQYRCLGWVEQLYPKPHVICYFCKYPAAFRSPLP